jgi:hypothetical protein
MIDVKRKIHIDLVALYDLAYQNDLPEICGALSNVEQVVWKLRRRDDKEITADWFLSDETWEEYYEKGEKA